MSSRNHRAADELADAFGLAHLVRLHLACFAAGLLMLAVSLLVEPEEWRTQAFNAILFRLLTPQGLGLLFVALALVKAVAFTLYPRWLTAALACGSVLFTWLCIACAAVYFSGEVNPMAPFAAVASGWLVVEHLAVASLVYRDQLARKTMRRIADTMPPPGDTP